jgi:methylenetetrahydrofolate dehydrogenase (NADP+) / methenyltetrahydrofolate cyclohydrolase
MTATILDGKALSEEIRAEIAAEAADFTRQTGITPCLAAVLVGETRPARSTSAASRRAARPPA